MGKFISNPYPCHYVNKEENKNWCGCYCENLAGKSELKEDCLYYEALHDMGSWSPWCRFIGSDITKNKNCKNCKNYTNKFRYEQRECYENDMGKTIPLDE